MPAFIVFVCCMSPCSMMECIYYELYYANAKSCVGLKLDFYFIRYEFFFNVSFKKVQLKIAYLKYMALGPQTAYNWTSIIFCQLFR